MGALALATVDRFNRQLHPDERQWAKGKAKDFAKFYDAAKKLAELPKKQRHQTLKEIAGA